MHEKKIFRMTVKKDRAKVTPDSLQKLSDKIMARFFESSFCQYSSFFVYIATKQEIQTQEIISCLLEQNKKVYVPVIINQEMLCARIDNWDELTPQAYGILSPPPTKGKHLDKVDVCLAPGLAFSKSGQRLGYGKGFFDRFFSCTKVQFRVGLVLEDFLFADLPDEPHDVSMHAIITEKDTYIAPSVEIL